MSWLHVVLWNTWGPISESVGAAFPGWGSSTVAMTANWGMIMFVVFVGPMCWATQRCGLRSGVVSSAVLMAIGTTLRCLTRSMPWFTILAQLCAILLGIASTLILAAPPLIAADWFPPGERTTAVAVMMGCSQLGSVGSYLEPFIVRVPGPGVTIEDLRNDIMRLLYIHAGFSGVLLLAVVVYFPSKPKIPPSVTSSCERLNFIPGVLACVRNKSLLLILASYAVSVGPALAWVSVLNYSLLPLGIHQNEAMWVGVGGRRDLQREPRLRRPLQRPLPPPGEDDPHLPHVARGVILLLVPPPVLWRPARHQMASVRIRVWRDGFRDGVNPAVLRARCGSLVPCARDPGVWSDHGVG
ncbi:solute carrier family 49 member 4 homolog isoform X2 [Penaeus chinensis]|uniref:solute carrier family 49 member 4 homolog isoform X2 n=1 Tax=Penaeus chinensis TaxID=139456 RepID=UPI001FB610A8|nr:solute carrier family 49 member 4 homolog isoform X2 [Penaeus chinensis]